MSCSRLLSTVILPCEKYCSTSSSVFGRGRRFCNSEWQYVTIKVLQKNRDEAEWDNYRSISLVPYVDMVLLKIIARRIKDSCKRLGILPEAESVSLEGDTRYIGAF